MPFIRVTEATRSEISSIPIIYGQFTIAVDTMEFFYDNGQSTRLLSSSIRSIDTENERKTMSSPEEDICYIVLESKNVYRYAMNSWVMLRYTYEVNDILSPQTELVIGTLKENGEYIAPRTLATAVFTKEGDILQDRLDLMMSLGMSSTNITIDKKNQPLLSNIVYPFDSYNIVGNHMILFKNKELIPNNEWELDGDDIHLTCTSNVGDIITIIFLYGTKIPPAVANRIDGGYITNHTIPTSKLSKVSDDTSLSDSNTLATSKAVYLLNQSIMNKIDAVSGNLIHHGVSSGMSNQIYLSMPGFSLIDGGVLAVRAHMDLTHDCIVKINNSPYFPIYIDYDTKLQDNMIRANDEFLLKYNAVEERFYVFGGEFYKLKTYQKAYTAKKGEISIKVNMEEFNPYTDELKVYYNNLPIFKDIDYTQNADVIVLNNYSTEQGDTFVFQVTKIVKQYK